MLIKFEELKKYIKTPVTGVLHIGAHECEEQTFYTNELQLNDENIFWVEANPKLVEKIKNDTSFKQVIIEGIISDKDNQEVNFNVTNNLQSSSFLNLGTHKKHHPWVYNVYSFNGKTKTITTLYKEQNLQDKKINFFNLDIQGSELLALKGVSDDIFKNIDYIYTEVNEEEVYENCGLINDIDSFLVKKGFKRVLTNITEWKWGDAFYIKD